MEDAMMEEYHNDVWDIVLKLELKSTQTRTQECGIFQTNLHDKIS